MPRPTIYAVASKAGVSIATVSRVLNNSARVKPATRDKVQKAMIELGYRPSATARGLATRHTGTLAYVLPDIKDALAIDCLRGIQAIAKEHNYHVLVVEQNLSANDETSNSAMILPSKVDGYVIAHGSVSEEDLAILQKQQIPVVLLYASPNSSASAVIVNEEQSAYTITSHIIRHSKRRIACIGDGLNNSLRVKGYERALTSHGLTVNPHLFVPGGHDANAGYSAMLLLLDLTIAPQAVFIADEQAALGALYAIKERGKRIPENIIVVSYGNTPSAAFSTPPLTTIHRDAFTQGRLATDLLIRCVADPNLESEQRTLETELIIRGSCGCNFT